MSEIVVISRIGSKTLLRSKAVRVYEPRLISRARPISSSKPRNTEPSACDKPEHLADGFAAAHAPASPNLALISLVDLADDLILLALEDR